MLAAALFSMQATQLPRTVFLPKNSPRKRRTQPTRGAEPRLTNYIVDEINAYAAIRDIALAEAEKEPNEVNVERAQIANNFVENCLKPARPLYEAQHLPEEDAVRERTNCQTVKVRLALMRAHLDAMTRTPAEAPEAAAPVGAA